MSAFVQSDQPQHVYHQQDLDNGVDERRDSIERKESSLRKRPPKIGQIPKHVAVELDDEAKSFPFNLINTKGDDILCSKTGPNMTPSFASVIESTKRLSLSSEVEQEHSFTQNDEPQLPVTCSSQMRKLLTSQLSSVSSSDGESLASSRPPGGDQKRRIFPNLPYSPYNSPTSSPRVRRKPLRETRRVNSTVHQDDGEYVQLNQYKLEGAIGQGSYGIVKLAYNKEDDSHYAMKILSKRKLKRKAGFFARGTPNRKSSKSREDPLQKVHREIALLKKLDHPNVVKLVEVLNDDEADNLYMVFELLEQGEVLSVPTSSPLDEKEAWLVFRDVILGLEYLHFQKIIHRDLKPSNLLRADSGEVKIADLGLSDEFLGKDAFLTNTAGTPAFTPPESLSHKPGDDPYSGKAADIWSLGVTLYCLVYGEVPFHDANILALYNKIRVQSLTFPKDRDVSPECRDLLQKMLVKDPESRITLPEIKIHDWVTGYGLYPLLSEEENCTLVEVTETEVDNSVHSVPKLDTLILDDQLSYVGGQNDAKESLLHESLPKNLPTDRENEVCS